uniref:Uncharacterized protein LOC111136546 isoform X1 n=1 Tax=Crassostrea virginica TaxID=6565 RepID=A0A8B8ETY3_CRAVI|nr:uncharacterized protein LOC111136546 isoform X1 [Crassostrea virginica]
MPGLDRVHVQVNVVEMAWRCTCQIILMLILLQKGVSLSSTLNDLQQQYGEWRLKRSPEYSTSIGFYKYNDKVETFAYKGFNEEYTKVLNILNHLRTTDYNQLSQREKTDYDIFNDTLSSIVNGYSWRDYNALNPINFLEGPQIDPSYLQSITPFDTVGDFENYLKRLELFPQQIEEMIERMNRSILSGHTYHNASVSRIPKQIDDVLKEASSTNFPMYKPFKEKLTNMSDIDSTTKNRLRENAQAAVSNIINKFRDLKVYFEKTYFQHLRPTFGVNGWDNGSDFYKACLRWHLSLDISPEDVHHKGLQEVERISSEMKTVMTKLKHQGSVKEFFAKVRNDPKNYLQTGEEIVQWYKNRIKNKIEPELPKFFKDLPNLPVDVQPNPIDGIGGQYLAGPPDGSRPGIFQVNVFHPNKSVKMNFMALLLHETIPGHHLQGSIQLTQSGPMYRRYSLDDKYFQPPFLPPFYTAYLEGWALYAEYLGEEMNLYEDDYEQMGRYGSEIFRACRLVVDTGLHHFNWTRRRAIDFMLNYTAYSEREITTEVDRYLTWPGQACAYKIGELKIKELRAKAQNELGSKFDIRDFHSIVLKDGALPLNILEKNVNQWISETKRSSTVTVKPCTSVGSMNNAGFRLLCIISIGLYLMKY